MSYICEITEKVKKKKVKKWSFFESISFMGIASFTGSLMILPVLLVLVAAGIIDSSNTFSQCIVALSLYIATMTGFLKLYNKERKTYKYLLSEEEIKGYLETLNAEQRKFAVGEIAKGASDNQGNISLALLMHIDEQVIKYANILNKMHLEECIKNKYNDNLILNKAIKNQSKSIIL